MPVDFTSGFRLQGQVLRGLHWHPKMITFLHQGPPCRSDLNRLDADLSRNRQAHFQLMCGDEELVATIAPDAAHGSGYFRPPAYPVGRFLLKPFDTGRKMLPYTTPEMSLADFPRRC